MPVPANKIKALLIGCCFFAHTSLFACLNEYYFNKDGESTSWGKAMPIFYNDQDTFAARSFIEKYDLKNMEAYDFKIQSDIGVKLTYLGDYKKALQIFIRLQKSHPDEYSITANLGTLYELMGNNEMALQFIKKGLTLNPDSHQKSEWVHVKILEAKIAVQKNPQWLSQRSVLGLGVNFESKRTGTEDREQQIADIEYQLQERVPFSKFPDLVLADVFNELGNLYAVEASAEMAYIAYEFSSQNGGDGLYTLADKKAKLAVVLKENETAIPDWHYHYRSRYEDPNVALLKSKAQALLSDPDKIINAVNTISDHFKQENERRDAERRFNVILGIAGGGVILMVLGLIFYFRRSKTQPYNN